MIKYISRDQFLTALAVSFFGQSLWIGFGIAGWVEQRQEQLRVGDDFILSPWVLLAATTLAALTLWKQKKLGIYIFHIVAIAHLALLIKNKDLGPRQDHMVLFYVMALFSYWKIVSRERRRLVAPRDKQNTPSSKKEFL